MIKDTHWEATGRPGVSPLGVGVSKLANYTRSGELNH